MELRSGLMTVPGGLGFQLPQTRTGYLPRLQITAHRRTPRGGFSFFVLPSLVVRASALPNSEGGAYRE